MKKLWSYVVVVGALATPVLAKSTFSDVLPVVRDAMQFIVDFLLLEVQVPGPAGAKGKIALMGLIATFAILYQLVHLGLRKASLFSGQGNTHGEKGAMVIAAAFAFAAAFLTPVAFWVTSFMEWMSQLVGMASAFLFLILFFGIIGGLFVLGRVTWNTGASTLNDSYGARLKTKTGARGDQETDEAKAHEIEQNRNTRKQESATSDAELAATEEMFGKKRLGLWRSQGSQQQAIDKIKKISAPTGRNLEALRAYITTLREGVRDLVQVGKSGDMSEKIRDQLGDRIGTLIRYANDQLKQYEAIDKINEEVTALTKQEWYTDKTAMADIESEIKSLFARNTGKTATEITSALSPAGAMRELNELKNMLLGLSKQKSDIEIDMRKKLDKLEDLVKEMIKSMDQFRKHLHNGAGDYTDSLKELDTIERYINTMIAYDQTLAQVLDSLQTTLTTEINNCDRMFNSVQDVVKGTRAAPPY